MEGLNISMLDHYGLQNGLNNGITMEDLRNKYHCTAKDVESQVERLYSNNRKQVKKCLSQLNRNAKKAKKVKADDTAEVVDVETATLVEVAEAVDELEESPRVASEILANIVAKRKNNLQDLEKSAKIQSNKVIDLEASVTTSRGAISAIDERIMARGARLNELSDLYDKEYANFLDDVNERNEAILQLEDNNLKLSDERATLVEIRQKIGERETLEIFVYADGRVIINDDNEEILVSDVEGTTTVYRDLLDKPECENLKLKDIKTLAKLIALKEISPYEIDLTCDNGEIDKAYSALA